MDKGQSRDINNLNWYVKKKYLELEAECKKQGVKIVVFETTRSNSYQEKLYSYGRTDMSKPIVTNMKKPVAHSEKIAIAFDIYVEVNGKAIWDSNHPHWQVVLKIARSMGFTCGHDWKMRDTCHFQLDEGLSTKQLVSGLRPSWFYEKPNTQQQPPLQVLKSKCIISDIDYWDKSLKTQKYVQSQNVKSLIINFYRYISGKDDFLEAMNYLDSHKVVTNKNYWLDICARNQDVDSEYVKLIVERMAKLIK